MNDITVVFELSNRYHRDSVVRIAFLQHLTNRRGSLSTTNYDNPGGRFLSLSKEGQLGIYTYGGTGVEFQKSITVREDLLSTLE